MPIPTAIPDWRDIEGFPGYKVNQFGDILSFKRSRRGRIRKQVRTMSRTSFYSRVILKANGKQFNKRVHRLVAYAFCPNDCPFAFEEVDHINQDPLDNRAVNLRWVDATLNSGNRGGKYAN